MLLVIGCWLLGLPSSFFGLPSSVFRLLASPTIRLLPKISHWLISLRSVLSSVFGLPVANLVSQIIVKVHLN